MAVKYDAAGHVGEFWGQHQSALNEFREVERMKPGLAEVHYNEGVALANLGRWADALVAFRKATSLKPRLLLARLGTILALEKLGRAQEATVEYRSAGRPDAAGPVTLRDIPYCAHYHRLPAGC